MMCYYAPVMRMGAFLLFFFSFAPIARAQPAQGEVPGSASAGSATVDYAYAQKCYYSLDRNKKEDWDSCVQKFQDVVDKYPQSPQVAKSLFSVGKLLQEKYDFVQDAQDLDRAFRIYNNFLRRFPGHTMADDALYSIAVLRWEKEGNGERARTALQALLERYPQGDKAPLAHDYLKKIGSGAVPKNLSGLVVSEPVVTKEEPVIRPDKNSAEALEDEEAPAAPPIQEKNLSKIPAVVPAAPHPPEFAIRRVVIDPGHGGEDTGAVGSKGTKESVVALQIARKLAFYLKKHLGVETYLTRTTNRNLSLDERNNFAARMKADLFISVHANASTSKKAGGVQTFYLNNATSEASKRLAVRENKTHAKKMDLSEQVLSALLQNADTEESRDLAKFVQLSLVNGLKGKYPGIADLQVDSALFYVLVGAKCPSILVETSFLTNPKEELRLRDTQYQWKVAEEIAKGVGRYMDNQKKLATSL